MNGAQVRRLVEEHASTSDCARACARAISDEHTRELTSGRLPAKDTLPTLRIRSDTVRASGKRCCGFAETISAMRALDPNTLVTAFHFKAAGALVTVFVAEPSQWVGCIAVLSS